MKRTNLLLSPETETTGAAAAAHQAPSAAPQVTQVAPATAPACTCSDGAPHGHYVGCPEYARIVHGEKK